MVTISAELSPLKMRSASEHEGQSGPVASVHVSLLTSPLRGARELLLRNPTREVLLLKMSKGQRIRDPVKSHQTTPLD